MGVNAAFQKMARFAGQGVIFGGSLYYALKEYGTYTFGNQDLLKESYRNLTESMNSRKVTINQKFIMILSKFKIADHYHKQRIDLIFLDPRVLPSTVFKAYSNVTSWFDCRVSVYL